MSEEHKHVNYLNIWFVLIAATVAELALAMTLQSQKLILIIVLVAIAFFKAALVAAFFMHLRLEKRTFVILVCAPLVLALVLVLSLMPDVGYMHR